MCVCVCVCVCWGEGSELHGLCPDLFAWGQSDHLKVSEGVCWTLHAGNGDWTDHTDMPATIDVSRLQGFSC